MAKQKQRRKSPTPAREKEPSPRMVYPRSVEKTMAAMHRVLEEKNLASIEDANAFLKEMSASGKMPEPEHKEAIEHY